MALYSLGLRTFATTAAGFIIEYRAGEKAFRLLELSGAYVPGVTSSYSLVKPTIVGAGPVSATLFQADNPSSPISTTTAAIQWSGSPRTVGSGFNLAANARIRSTTQGSSQAGGFLWTFPNGLPILPGQSIGIYGHHSTGVALLDLNCVIEE